MVAAATLASLALTLAREDGHLEPGERALFDAFQARSPGPGSRRAEDRLVRIEITDACLARHGPWPWPRERLADLVEALGRARPKVIGVDLLLLDPDPAQDPRLAAALAEASPVVLAAEADRRTVWDNEAGGLVTGLAVTGPAPELARAAAGLGLVNVDFEADNQDGVVRKMPLVAEVEGRLVPVLALALVSRYLGSPVASDPQGVRLGSWVLPLDPARRTGERSGGEDARMLKVPFPGTAYLRYQHGGSEGAIPAVRALDVLAGEVPPQRFRDRILVLGLNVRGMDRKVTPVGIQAGMEIQAQLARNLLDRSLLTRMSPGLGRLAVLGASLLGLVVAAQLPALAGACLLAVLAAGWLAGARLAFERGSFLVDVYGPVLGALLAWGASLVTNLSLALRARLENLRTLHRSSLRLARTLDLDALLVEVAETYREVTQARGVLVVVSPGEDADPEIRAAGLVDEGLRALLGRRRLQQEILRLMDAEGSPLSASRLAELADMPGDQEIPAGAVLLPIGRFEKALGFVLVLAGRRRPLLDDPEDRRFWSTHSSVAATAVENAGLYRLATVDALTGLYLRHYFDTALRREFARVGRHKGHLALLVTDVDFFKRFNDTHGHQVGDRVLRHVAEKVRDSVRDVDIPCRYGGEEFGIVLPDTDFDGAMLTAERIRRTIEESLVAVGDKQLGVTISIGMSCTDRSRAQSPEAMVEEADQALYRAKQAGRNRVEAHQAADLAGPVDA